TICACAGVNLSSSTSELFSVIGVLDEAGTRDRFRMDMFRLGQDRLGQDRLGKEDAIKAEAMAQVVRGAITDEISGEDTPGMGAPAVHTAVFGADERGLRLDRALAARMDGLSRSRLKTLILAGHVAISGRTIRDPGHRVNAGDEVSVVVPQA